MNYSSKRVICIKSEKDREDTNQGVYPNALRNNSNSKKSISLNYVKAQSHPVTNEGD